MGGRLGGRVGIGVDTSSPPSPPPILLVKKLIHGRYFLMLA